MAANPIATYLQSVQTAVEAGTARPDGECLAPPKPNREWRTSPTSPATDTAAPPISSRSRRSAIRPGRGSRACPARAVRTSWPAASVFRPSARQPCPRRRPSCSGPIATLEEGGTRSGGARHDDGPELEGDIDDPPGGRQRILKLRRDREQLPRRRLCCIRSLREPQPSACRRRTCYRIRRSSSAAAQVLQHHPLTRTALWSSARIHVANLAGPGVGGSKPETSWVHRPRGRCTRIASACSGDAG